MIRNRTCYLPQLPLLRRMTLPYTPGRLTALESAPLNLERDVGLTSIDSGPRFFE